MAERHGCARESTARGEPQLATASQVRRWLLVEQPGSWGIDAARESDLPDAAAAHLLEQARQAGARLLLIRRGPTMPDRPRRVFVASSVAARPWIERLDVADDAELTRLDLAPLADDASVGGQPVDGPLLLTCTNGKHDACCAELGRPTAITLCRELGEQAWECSHIGGDRFAANVLALPHGVYYGRVQPDDALELAERHRQGRLSLQHLRGRSTVAFDVQAAEHFLRERLGEDRLDAVVPRSRRRDDGAVAVELDAPGGRYRVSLEVTAEPTPQWLTCRAKVAGTPPRYALQAIEALDPPTSG